MTARATAHLLAVPIFLCAIGATAHAQTPPAKPSVWMGVPGYEEGKCWRELFEHPGQWQETRSVVKVIQYADHVLNRQFKDDELRNYFSQLNQWGLKLSMEVGAIKSWGPTGEKAFAHQKPNWDRFVNLGAKLYAIALDEPLICCRKQINKPDDYAVQETANFIALVRKNFPQMLIGDIEPYPSIPMADHAWWLSSLQKKLADMQVRGLDFYRLDVNWIVFTVQKKGNWDEVRQIELLARQHQLPFSLIYWAAGQPYLAKKGQAKDSTWYELTMQQAQEYSAAGGHPDQLVIQSWLKASTPRCLPETDQWTFTRSVLDVWKKCGK